MVEGASAMKRVLLLGIITGTVLGFLLPGAALRQGQSRRY